MAIFESLIDDIGGLGRFQLLLMFAIETCQFTAGWSMLQMSFARLSPDYQCLVENVNASIIYNDNNNDDDILNVCEVNGTRCSSFHTISSSRTVTSEWSLVCDRKWIQKTIISAQMAGVLVGALLAGHLGDAIGRKKVLYSFVVYHIICNFVAAASSDWIMFCAMRFFIGIALGAILVMCLPYPMEFLPVKWRPILSIIPTWAAGVSVFAASAVILDNWSHLHIACAVVSIPSIFGGVFVPESMRWLTMQGRLEEAEEALAKIARWNGKTLPEHTKELLQQAYQKEKESKQSKRMYTFIDIFITCRQARISLCLWILWLTLSITYYGISFGVASLHGNIFLNIFLLGILEIPVQSTTFFTNNKFGRRWSAMIFFGASSLTMGSCLVCRLATSGQTQGISINVLSMILKTLVGSAWSCLQVWGSELYPTVTRNLGFGFTSTGARVGGILAPFIIRLDSHMTLSYGLLTGLLVFGTCLCRLLPETRGQALQDSARVKCRGDNAVLTFGNVDDKENHRRETINGNELSPLSECTR